MDDVLIACNDKEDIDKFQSSVGLKVQVEGLRWFKIFSWLGSC